jgi:hypothetical protein
MRALSLTIPIAVDCFLLGTSIKFSEARDHFFVLPWDLSHPISIPVALRRTSVPPAKLIEILAKLIKPLGKLIAALGKLIAPLEFFWGPRKTFRAPRKTYRAPRKIFRRPLKLFALCRHPLEKFFKVENGVIKNIVGHRRSDTTPPPERVTSMSCPTSFREGGGVVKRLSVCGRVCERRS